MHIKIAERLKPFSHLPGTKCVIPHAHLQVQVFPARLVFFDATSENSLLAEFPVPVEAPLKEFTVQLDLENECLNIWGVDARGYFKYHLFGQEKNVIIYVEKGLIDWKPALETETLKIRPLENAIDCIKTYSDRLSLGNHKAQDWDLVKRRKSLIEILPFWLKLGQQVPSCKVKDKHSLLALCQSSTDIVNRLKDLFEAGFDGILAPQTQDNNHLGFSLPPISPNISPLVLLTEGAKLIRSHFVSTKDHSIYILNQIDPLFHCGRFLHVQCEDFGKLDIEWTKKSTRRAVFYAEKTAVLNFNFSKEIKRYRLNGRFISAGIPLSIEKDRIYQFDRFEK